MKQSEINAVVMSGVPNVVATYWGGAVTQITFRDKKTGQAKTANIIRETVLTAKEPMSVTRFMKDDENPADWKPSAKQMDKVFIRITDFGSEKGNIGLQGTIEVISG